MKKIIFFFLFVSIKGLAQDPELINITWNSYSVTIGGETFNAPHSENPPVNPEILFEANGTTYSIDDCADVVSPSISYDTPNSQITLFDYIVLLGKCPPHFPEYTKLYFGFLEDSVGNIPKTFTYEIVTNPDNSKTLILTDENGDIGLFGTTMLTTSSFIENNFSIFPNPASKTLFITSENLQIEQLSVFNPSGQKVMELNEITTEIDVSSLQNGIYFLKITSEEGTTIKKFVKK